MNTRVVSRIAIALAAASAVPAAAETETETTASESETVEIRSQSAQSAPARPAFKPVFDDTWATIGLGAGLVPSYAGSDDYIVFPVPVITGRVGGVGIRPNGPGFVLDFNSPEPSFAPRTKPRVSFGPALRIRNDRNILIQDDVVEAAGVLDLALEAGAAAGVSFPGVLRPFDNLNISAQVRWDVLGAHEGMVIEPQVTYNTSLGKGFGLLWQSSLEIVDDNFADYYFDVNAAQSIASGLPRFDGEGGLNRIGTTAILSYDLDGNPINGGMSVFGIGGYARMLGDGADTPFTSLRGDADQFFLGLGLGYTF